MVWFFERGMEMAVLEVRRRELQFEVAVRLADGDEQVDVLPTASELLKRLEGVPNTLLVEGWRPISGFSVLSVQGIREIS